MECEESEITLCLRETHKRSFANNEDQDKKLYNAVFLKGLHSLLRNKDFQSKIHFLNYNLTPIDKYNGLSLVRCINEKEESISLQKVKMIRI